MQTVYRAVDHPQPLHPLYAAILLYLAERHGLSRSALCTPAQLCRLEARQSPRWLASLLLKILREPVPPGLGFDCGQLLDLPSAGVIGQAVMTAPRLGQAFDILCRYYALSGLSVFICRTRVADEIHISFDIGYRNVPDPVRIFFIEALLSSWRASARLLIGQALPLKRVNLAYPPPRYRHLYRDTLGCPLQFNAAQNRLVVDAELAGMPVVTANPVVHARAVAHCESALLRQRQPVSTAERVSRYLMLLPALGDAGLGRVAQALNTSARTLNRRLQQEGTGFKRLLEQVRRERARRLLIGSDWGIDRVADQLGYSDTSNFRRAFRKWTGDTPRSYRALHRGIRVS
ncbi:MAG: AraC family transcriptional regulator ligand-binding domain-containing protein [Spongiibacteraceae bacterium]|jgi:AraC-like DNA-binding protein|nr:AraC family transcriptional regulator ligand-binding domain-containing protein [Spongiibacteraceae bacterium]